MIPEGVKTIKDREAMLDAKLGDLVIPASVEKLGENVFDHRADLRSVTFEAMGWKGSADTFNGCTGLQWIRMHESVNAPWGSLGFGGLPAAESEFYLPMDVVLYCGEAQFGKANMVSKLTTAVAWLEDETPFSQSQREYLQKFVKKNKVAVLNRCVERNNSKALNRVLPMLKCTDIELDELITLSEDPGKLDLKIMLMEYKNRSFTPEQLHQKADDRIDKVLGVKELSAAEWKKIFKIAYEDGNAVITGYKSENSMVTVPEKIGTKPVTAIGKDAFRYAKAEQIVLPEGLKEIRAGAFAGTALVKLTIPATVEYLGENFNLKTSHFVSGSLVKVYIPLVVCTGSKAEEYAMANGMPFESI